VVINQRTKGIELKVAVGADEYAFDGNRRKALKAQVKYVKQMNLIVFVWKVFGGKTNKLYDLCDEYMESC